MRRLLLGLSLALAVLVSPAAAQEEDAGAARTRTRVIRPPEGSLRRGAFPVPGWVLYVGGGLVVAAAGGALAYRIRKSRR